MQHIAHESTPLAGLPQTLHRRQVEHQDMRRGAVEAKPAGRLSDGRLHQAAWDPHYMQRLRVADTVFIQGGQPLIALTHLIHTALGSSSLGSSCKILSIAGRVFQILAVNRTAVYDPFFHVRAMNRPVSPDSTRSALARFRARASGERRREK